MSLYCTIYLVRHGETEWNLAGRLQGHTDSPLTPTGILQAKALATSLSHIHFSAIYSSDLPRALKTAKYVALDQQLTVTTTDLLRERFFGRYEGKPWVYFQQKLEKLLRQRQDLMGANNLFHQIDPGIETDDQIADRVLRFLREASLANLGHSILMVTHGGTMRTVLLHLGAMTSAELHLVAIQNTAYIKLQSDGTDFFIMELVGITKKI